MASRSSSARDPEQRRHQDRRAHQCVQESAVVRIQRVPVRQGPVQDSELAQARPSRRLRDSVLPVGRHVRDSVTCLAA